MVDQITDGSNSQDRKVDLSSLINNQDHYNSSSTPSGKTPKKEKRKKPAKPKREKRSGDGFFKGITSGATNMAVGTVKKLGKPALYLALASAVGFGAIKGCGTLKNGFDMPSFNLPSIGKYSIKNFPKTVSALEDEINYYEGNKAFFEAGVRNHSFYEKIFDDYISVLDKSVVIMSTEDLKKLSSTLSGTVSYHVDEAKSNPDYLLGRNFFDFVFETKDSKNKLGKVISLKEKVDSKLEFEQNMGSKKGLDFIKDYNFLKNELIPDVYEYDSEFLEISRDYISSVENKLSSVNSDNMDPFRDVLKLAKKKVDYANNLHDIMDQHYTGKSELALAKVDAILSDEFDNLDRTYLKQIELCVNYIKDQGVESNKFNSIFGKLYSKENLFGGVSK